MKPIAPRLSIHDVGAALVAQGVDPDSTILPLLLVVAAGSYASLTVQALFEEPFLLWNDHLVLFDLRGDDEFVENEFYAGNIVPRLGNLSMVGDLARGCVASAVARYGSYDFDELCGVLGRDAALREVFYPMDNTTPITLAVLRDAFRRHYAAGVVSPEILDRFFSSPARSRVGATT